MNTLELQEVLKEIVDDLEAIHIAMAAHAAEPHKSRDAAEIAKSANRRAYDKLRRRIRELNTPGAPLLNHQ